MPAKPSRRMICLVTIAIGFALTPAGGGPNLTPWLNAASWAAEGSINRANGSRESNTAGSPDPLVAPGRGGERQAPSLPKTDTRPGLILVSGLTSQELQSLTTAGFRLVETVMSGNAVHILRVPSGMDATQGRDFVRKTAPIALVDLDTIYTLPQDAPRSALALCASGPSVPSGAPDADQQPVPIGLIDTAVDEASLPSASVQQISPLGPNASVDRTHGTEFVQALAAPAKSAMPGLLPSARIVVFNAATTEAGRTVADAAALVRGLAALSQARSKVIAISFVGPPNALVAQALQTAMEQDIVIVATADDGGLATTRSYPAAYDGVISAAGSQPAQRSSGLATNATPLLTAAAALLLSQKQRSTPDDIRRALAVPIEELLQTTGVCSQRAARIFEAKGITHSAAGAGTVESKVAGRPADPTPTGAVDNQRSTPPAPTPVPSQQTQRNISKADQAGREGPASQVRQGTTFPGSIPQRDQPVNAKLQSAEQLFIDYLRHWSAAKTITLAEVGRFYAAPVDFYGRHFDLNQLVAEKRRFIQQWPDRDYEARPGSLRASCDRPQQICNVTGLFDFRASDTRRGRSASGTGRLSLKVALGAPTPRIIAERSTVVSHGRDRHDRSGS